MISPPLLTLTDELMSLALTYGYFGVFVVGLIGSMSIFFPIPYTLVIYFLGPFLDPFLLALFCGLGSAIGEFVGYALGYYGRKVVSEKHQKRFDAIMKLIGNRSSLVIFLFALTPLPDDLLFIPLGLLRYSLLRAFIPCLIGKFAMLLILAYSGRVSYTFVLTVFQEGGLPAMIATIVALTVIVVTMLKVDWERILEKYLKKKEKGKGGENSQ